MPESDIQGWLKEGMGGAPSRDDWDETVRKLKQIADALGLPPPPIGDRNTARSELDNALAELAGMCSSFEETYGTDTEWEHAEDVAIMITAALSVMADATNSRELVKTNSVVRDVLIRALEGLFYFGMRIGADEKQ